MTSCSCPTCKALGRRKLSGPARLISQVYNRNVLTVYRAVKAWLVRSAKVIDQTLRVEWPGGFAKSQRNPYEAVDIVPWDKVDEMGRATIGPHQVRIFGQAMGRAGELAKIKTPWNLANQRAIQWAALRGGEKITAVAEETRAALRGIVERGLKEGLSVGQLAREMRDVPRFGLNDRQADALLRYSRKLAAEKLKIVNALREAGGNVGEAARLLRGHVSEKIIRSVAKGQFNVTKKTAQEYQRKLAYRAEMIARTETAAAVSAGTLEGYAAAQLQHIRFEAALDACDICAGYDGNTYTLLEGDGMLPIHVSCRCTWTPVMGEPGQVGATAQTAQAAQAVEVPSLVNLPVEVPAASVASAVAGVDELVDAGSLLDNLSYREATKEEAAALKKAWRSIPKELKGDIKLGDVELRILTETDRRAVLALNDNKLYVQASDLKGSMSAVKHELYHARVAKTRIEELGGADNVLADLRANNVPLPYHAAEFLSRGSPEGAVDEMLTMLADNYRYKPGMSKTEFSDLLRNGGPAQRVMVLRNGVVDYWTKAEADQVTDLFYRTLKESKPKAPRVPKVLKPKPISSPFSSGEITSHAELGGGCNSSMKVHIGGDGDGVYKPKKGEVSLRDTIPKGTYYKREVAASVLDKEMGLGLVPETLVKKGKDGIGSVQAWVENAKIGADVERDLVAIAERDRLTVFDLLIGNTDRHRGNWMFKDGKVVAIDNGLAFPTNRAITASQVRLCLPFYYDDVSERLDPEMLSKLKVLVERKEAVGKKLSEFLSKEEVDSLFQRAELIIENSSKFQRLVRSKLTSEGLIGLKGF